MKNECLKQANVLMNWLETNDKETNDVIVTITLKNGNTYKIMNDGSIIQLSSTSNDNKSFNNASELISAIEVNAAKKMHDAIFKIKLPKNAIELSEVSDMTFDSCDDNFAFLTYKGNESEEPETVANDIRLKYGIQPISIKKL